MARVFIPAALRSLTDGLSVVDVPGASVGEIIDELDAQWPGMRNRLCDDGRIRLVVVRTEANTLQVVSGDHFRTSKVSSFCCG